MWSRILLSVFLFLASAAAQTGTPKVEGVDSDFVHQAFGDTCSFESGWPAMTGDLNDDGVDDVMIVARCKNPLVDQGDKNYKVIDPMDSFFGYGNPAITTGFAPDDPKLRGIDVLVIHGSGPDAWHSKTPQAKYVIINIPVKTVCLKKMRLRKKKLVTAIYIEEAGGDQMTSALFWDGHKYRYEPLGTSMDAGETDPSESGPVQSGQANPRPY